MVQTAKQHALFALNTVKNYRKKRPRRTFLKKSQKGGIFPLALPYLRRAFLKK